LEIIYFFFAGAAAMGFATAAWHLIIGRFLIGLGCGFFTLAVPMYLAEISPIPLRGAIMTFHQLGVVFGILLSQILGMFLSYAPGWRILFALTAALSIIQLIVFPFCPESPIWFLKQGDHKTAKITLKKLRGQSVGNEFHNLKEEVRDSALPSGSFLELFGVGTRKLIVIAIALQLAQQLSGIVGVFYYSTSIFQKAGIEDPSLATVITGIVMVVMTPVAIFFMDRAGRRPLLLIGQGIETIALAMLVFTLLFADSSPTLMLYLSVVSVLIFVAAFSIGIGPIAWALTAELYSDHLRGHAMSVATGVNWLSNFLVAISFLRIQNALGGFSIILFMAIVFAFLVFTYCVVPETKGTKLGEIPE